MGTHIPLIRSRAADTPGMAEGDRTNQENKAINITSRVSNPIRTETPRMRTSPMHGLQGPEPDNDPKPIPPPTYAGIATPGTGSPMVHENGPQKRVPPNSDEERGQMEDRLQNPLRTV